MNDTSPEVEVLYREKLSRLTGEERFLRGARMFETARVMVLASLPPGLGASEVKRALLHRFYEEDLTPGELKAVERIL